MPKSLRTNTKLLYAIAILLALNAVVVTIGVTAVVTNHTEETKLYSASKFKLIYDGNKVAVTNLGGLRYDDDGNLDKFELSLQNKDLLNTYSCTLEVTAGAQFSQIQVYQSNRIPLEKSQLTLTQIFPHHQRCQLQQQ